MGSSAPGQLNQYYNHIEGTIIMTTTSQTNIATAIAGLDSSLKSRILMSGAFRVGGRAISLVEKLNRLDAAEQKYGRSKINPDTGEP